ncbi:MAG: catalase [Ruminococcaceae bacterium]|nr:catalase [Oscillospiraceae bacterium]
MAYSFLVKAFKHTALVMRHKHKVLIGCFKCGIPLRGFLHDLSKFSPAEFIESVRYFQGNRSPIGVCRREKGYSSAWLHHKGRNPHHLEYWSDSECPIQPPMPYKYAVECICDKISATKTYAGKSYHTGMPLEHWNRYHPKTPCNEKNLEFITRVFEDLKEHGEKYILNRKYMKALYSEIFGA